MKILGFLIFSMIAQCYDIFHWSKHNWSCGLIRHVASGFHVGFDNPCELDSLENPIQTAV